MSEPAALSDYSKLLDAQVHTFIASTNAAFPADAASLSIADQRKLYDAMCSEFRVDYPEGISSRDATISPLPPTTDSAWRVPVRHYKSGDSTSGNSSVQLVYLHGGGFVVGGLESHDDVCAEICYHTRCKLTSVDYRLSPEHQHPDALQDVMLVINSLWLENSKPIIICGDSAGANLAAAACHAVRKLPADSSNTPVISAQVLIYPGLGGDMSKGSYVIHAQAPMLTTSDVHYYSHVRCRTDDDLHDPLFAPLCDDDFSNLPPTVVISAQCDPLSDDGCDYCDHIQQAGGKAHWINEQGLVHGYLRARHSVDRASASFQRITAAISSLASGQWPYS